MALFGATGQEMVRKVSVAIVGTGGLGSHVAQQLAYAGVADYRLIDADTVERSNLNRLVGAYESDLGRCKVDVASDCITAIQPDARIDVVRESVISKAGFDLATDVPELGRFGGRVIFTGIGKGCPYCREEFDTREIRRFFMSPEERQEDDRIYGIDRSALGQSGPSVVFLNGVIASLAVTEFTCFITGLREPVAQLNYRGEKGIVTTSIPPSQPCYYCGDIWNGRATADLTRYLADISRSRSDGDVYDSNTGDMHHGQR